MELRRLEIGKELLIRAIGDFASNKSHARVIDTRTLFKDGNRFINPSVLPAKESWEKVRVLSNQVEFSLASIGNLIEKQRHLFMERSEMGRAYRDLLISFHEKGGILEEMNSIGWRFSGVTSRHELSEQQSAIEGLRARLGRELRKIGAATDALGEQVDTLCAQVYEAAR